MVQTQREIETQIGRILRIVRRQYYRILILGGLLNLCSRMVWLDWILRRGA